MTTFKGTSGNDTFIAVAGSNTYLGYGGINTLSLVNATAGVDLSLAAGTFKSADNQYLGVIRSIGVVIGSSFGDNLSGSKAANQLYGGAGDDTLTGAAGSDTLSGGAGADTFVYKSVADSTVSSGGRDFIADFDHAQGDRIDLSAIDANTAISGDQAFTLVSSFTHTAGELVASSRGFGNYLVMGDVNGDGHSDFAILVHSTAPLVSGDFVL